MRAAVGVDHVLVVCLTAPPETVAERIVAREPDHWPGKRPLIERARRLARDTAGIAEVDVVIDTERTLAEDVAAEIFRAMRSRGIISSVPS